MNILIVSQYFWPENFRINEMAADLVDRGHSVTVLTGLPNYPGGRIFDGYSILTGPWKQEWRGVQIIRVPLVPRGGSGGARLALNYLSYVLSASLAAAFIRWRGDVIFAYEPSPITVGIPSALISRITGAPQLLWVLDIWPESLTAAGAVKSKAILDIFSTLVTKIYSWCDRILVQSKAFYPFITRHNVPEDKIRYYPHSAERLFHVVAPDVSLPEASMMPEGFRIMFAGNIGEAQGFDTILDAAEDLRQKADIHWVILGDGRRRAWVEQQIRERGLENTVHLLGSFPVERMPYFFAFADAMLVTLKRNEVFSLTIPCKVQSYLACAKPIIASLDGEGARIIRESGSGFAVPAGDHGALAKAVLSAYEMDSGDLNRLGRMGRVYFEEHFDPDILIERLESWMRELIREARQ